VAGNIPVVPTQESLRVSNRAADPATIRGNAPEHFFGRQPISRPEPFQRQAAQVQTDIQHNSNFTPIPAEARSGGNVNNANTVGDRTSFGEGERRAVGNNRGSQIRSTPNSISPAQTSPNGQDAHVNSTPANNNWRHFGGNDQGNRTQPATANQP